MTAPSPSSDGGTARLVSSETGDTVWTNTLYKLMPAGSDGTLTYARSETLNTAWNLSASASVELRARSIAILTELTRLHPELPVPTSVVAVEAREGRRAV